MHHFRQSDQWSERMSKTSVMFCSRAKGDGRSKCWLDFRERKSTLARWEAGSFPYRKAVRHMSEEIPKREMETLWCPWRVEYFEREKPDANFLSEAARTSDDAAHFVITRRKNAFLMMNRYPYAVGHLMAVPYRKTAGLAAMGEKVIVELWDLVTDAQPLVLGT